MSKFHQQLRENKNKIKRKNFLSALDPKFSDLLSNAEFSSDLSCIKYAAFPTLDNKSNLQTTTRGEVADWKNFTFKTWHDLISVLEKFQKLKNYIGWFFVDSDGPYYKVSLIAFLSNIESISNYGITHEHFDFGWVGAEDDVGIIIGDNQISSAAKKFQVSVWGI